MRTLLKLILLFLAVAYLIFATVTFLWRKDDTPCRTVSIVIADSAQATLITRDAVEKMLHKSGHYPVGQSMTSICWIWNSKSRKIPTLAKSFA